MGTSAAHFVGKAVDRSLVGRAVDPKVGNLDLPERQLPIEVVEVGEAAAGDEVAFDVFHAGLDLALGLGPVGPTQPRRETPVVGEGGEGGVEFRLALAVLVGRRAEDDGAHAIVEQELAAATEVGEGPLMGSQQVGNALAREAFGVAPAAVAEGHHEDMDLAALSAERYGDLAPVDLGLFARTRFEPALREAGKTRFCAQRANRELDGFRNCPRSPAGCAVPGAGCAPSN